MRRPDRKLKMGAGIAHLENDHTVDVRGDVNRTGRMPYRISDELAEDHFRVIAVGLPQAQMPQELDKTAASRKCLASADRLEIPPHSHRRKSAVSLVRGRSAADVWVVPMSSVSYT